ncbi:unnamed protein product, partial [Rotaria sp. Silwood1]
MIAAAIYSTFSNLQCINQYNVEQVRPASLTTARERNQ